MTRTIQLTDLFINYLVHLPESGMGYQLVKVYLKNGNVLHQHKVFNSALLMQEVNEDFTVSDIDRIEPENKAS